MAQLSLPLHSYAIEESASSARLVNCYAEAAPPDSKAPVILRRAPGIAAFADGTGKGRGLSVMRGALFAVGGSTLSRVAADGALTAWGQIGGVNHVQMCNNGTQLLITTGDGAGYVAENVTVNLITDSDFRAAGSCDFVGNYAALTENDSGRWFISDLADFSSYDGLNFATAESSPDNLRDNITDHGQVLLLGETSSELWDLTGASGFPFERSANGIIALGAASRNGSCSLDNTAMWLANDLTLRRLNGNTPVRISQHGVERALRALLRTDDCEAYDYTLEGHLCAVFNFPSAGRTFVYDATTGECHERESFPGGAWDISGIAMCYGKVYVQRRSTGEIGELSRTCYSEWGNPLRASWTYQAVYAQNAKIAHSRLQMGIETGVGTTSGQGYDPRITLELSNNYGRTFPIVMPTRSIGKQGVFHEIVQWNLLGATRGRVYRASFSDPAPLTVWDTILKTAS